MKDSGRSSKPRSSTWSFDRQPGNVAPPHVPPWQTSVRVHALPSSQRVPLGTLLSDGHVAEVPLQVSATSHEFAAGRHVVPAFPAGCWHDRLTPSHRSAV